MRKVGRFGGMTAALGFAICAALLCSCSLNKLAVGAVSDALGGKPGRADSGTVAAVFASDEDPELVGAALPFAIKVYEALLAENPAHQGLAVTTASLFVMYGNAFVQGPAALYPSERYEERQAANERAQRLYLRGADILAEALERRFPRYERDFADGKPAAALKKAAKGDAALFYWTAAATLSAWSIDPLDIALGRRLPLMLSLIDTAYRLDPDFNGSALDELYLLIYASLPEAMGGDKELAAVWFNRALEKSAFLSAGPYIAWAEAVAIPAQDYGLFRDCLEKALAIDADKNKTIRMANLLSQRKARFLLDNATHYFIDTGEDAFDWEADG